MDDLLDGLEAVTRQRDLLIATTARVAGAAARAIEGISRSNRDKDGYYAEVAAMLHESEYGINRFLTTSDLLTTTLQDTLTSVESGRITWKHAEVIVAGCDGLEPERVADVQTTAIRLARNSTVPQLRDAMRRMRDTIDPAGMAERHRTAMQRRTVLLEPRADGMAVLTIEFDAVDAVAIKNRLHRIAVELHGAADETRCVGELQADLARDLLLADLTNVHTVDSETLDADVETSEDVDTSEDADVDVDVDVEPEVEVDADPAMLIVEDPIDRGAVALAVRAERRIGTRRIRDAIGVVPEVHITVPVDTLVARVGPDSDVTKPVPGFLAGYGAIDPDTTCRLVGHAPTFARILMSKQDGAVLDVGRGRQRITKDLQRWLEIRDGTCRFPGCRRTARSCEIDHTIAVEDHGDTIAGNLAHLCTRHHQIKHDTEWRPWQDSWARLHWQSPYGRRHVTEPALRTRYDDDAFGDPHPPKWPTSPKTGPLPDEPPFSGRPPTVIATDVVVSSIGAARLLNHRGKTRRTHPPARHPGD